MLVAYAFPPVGGAGVQRMSKLAKYLPQHGIVPSVLTVANPSVPLTDESLARDLPSSLEVIRARSLEPGYAAKKVAWEAAADAKPSKKKQLVRFASDLVRQLAYPDIQILWMPGAHAALASTLAKKAPDVVLISGPPFSQFLLAPLARTRAAVVLDYRDEWSLIRESYEMTRSTIARIVGDPLEALLLKTAHMVTTATEEFRENLLRRFPFLDPKTVVAIPNGYDPEDFPKGALPLPPKDKLVVSHVGTVFKLTSPTGLLGAIRKVHEREPELAKLLKVKFVGRITDLEAKAFEGMDALGVERIGYMDHDDAVRELAASHIVLVILDDTTGVERIYPAKIFEAMYMGRPTLTLAPDGALSRLVTAHKIGDRLPPRDEEAICNYLVEKLRAFKDGMLGHTMSPIGIAQYDRREIAASFATVMRKAIERAGKGTVYATGTAP